MQVQNLYEKCLMAIFLSKFFLAKFFDFEIRCSFMYKKTLC